MNPGFELATSFQFDRPGEAPGVRSRVGIQDQRKGLDSQSYLEGSFTENQPISPLSLPFTGVCQRSFFEDYYNRVYFIPPIAALGAVSVRTDFIVQVWNAHLNETELTAVLENTAQGLTLTGAAVPQTFTELEIKEYTITSFPEGPATINANYRFTFDTPEVFELRVTGSRARITPLVPSWQNPFRIQYSYQTEIITSRTGIEQRRAMRDTPRKSVEFFAVATRQNLVTLNGFMAAWQNNVAVMPEVPREIVLASPITSTDTIIATIGAIPAWALDGAGIILSYRGEYESAIISATGANSVTLAGTTSRDWPAGTKIHPTLAGRFQTNITTRRETNEAATVTLNFDVTPGSEPVVEIPAADATFNAIELFEIKPNWAAIPAVSYQSEREIIDYGFGVTSTFTPVDFRSRGYQATYTGRDFDSAEKILNLFRRMRGQQGEFYMPTWENDIRLQDFAAANSQTIRVAGTQFATDYADSTVHKALTVALADGTLLHRNVQSVIADNGDSVIQVDAAWPVDLTADSVKFISWLLRWRFSSDALTVEWLTNKVAQTQLSLISLEDRA